MRFQQQVFDSVKLRLRHTERLDVNEDVCDFGKGFADLQPDVRGNVVRLSDRDLRIDFNVKINVMLEPGPSRVALLDAPDSCNLKSGRLYALD